MVGYNGSIHWPNNGSQGCNHACIGTVSLGGSQVSIVVGNLAITIWSKILWSTESHSKFFHVSKTCSIDLGSFGSQEFVLAIPTDRIITSVKSWVKGVEEESFASM